MNYELIKEMFQVRRSFFGALALLAALDAGLYGYGALWQEPRLKQAQQAFAAGAAEHGGGERERAVTYHNGVRDLALFDQRIIAKRDFAKFLAEIFDTARANSLAVKSTTYRPTDLKDRRMVAYAISFTVSGRYPAIKRFIGEICRLPQIVTVDSLSLSNSSKTEESVDLRLQLTTYLKTEGA